MNSARGRVALVTGATGSLGPSVVAALLRAGYRVRTLALDRPQDGLYAGPVESYAGEITDKTLLDKAVAGSDVMVHLAAILHIENPTPELRPEYERVNVYGTELVIEAALRYGLSRVVFFSTIAIYGGDRGEMLTETSEPRPKDYYAKTKLAAERIVLSARRSEGEPVGTVFRLGAVYGSRIKGNYQRMVRALDSGRFIPVGRGLNRRTLVHEKDVASAAVLAIEKDAAAGKVFNVTDGRVHTLAEIIQAICKALGRRSPRISLPVKPARALIGLLEDASSLLGLRTRIGRATLNKYLEDMAVDGSSIHRELGFVPRYDLAKGWKETIREMRGKRS